MKLKKTDSGYIYAPYIPDFKVEKVEVKAKSRQLKGTWTLEMGSDKPEDRPKIEKTEDYFDDNYKEYKKYCATSSNVIPVLEFLWGQPYDELVKNYLPALRPSYVRVTDIMNCDARMWRVTIHVNKDNIIERIEQEVEVGCNGALHGHDLQIQMSERGVKMR